MESASKVQVVKEAIKQVMEEAGASDDDILLSKLMSQLEGEPPCPALSRSSGDELLNRSNMSRTEEDEERIMKELKKLRRQNLITHCLLSVMIVLTAAWQISEVSIILKLKDGVSHPFRSIGSVLKSMIKPRPLELNGNQDDTEPTCITSNLIESTPVHDLKIPALPLPKFDLGFNARD